jgi:tryptophan synthase alpha chain
VTSLEALFAATGARAELAFIPYFTAGYPSVEASLDMVEAAFAGAADAVEIGLPHSDPIADGPSIQFSAAAALADGFRTRPFLDALARRSFPGPVIVMTYLNPLIALGADAVSRIANSGASGLVVPDLPVEGCGLLAPGAARANLDLALLVAPTTPVTRMRAVAEHSRGFLYVVAVTGVTGARTSMERDLGSTIARARSVTPLPLVAGFGFSTAAQIAELARHPPESRPQGVIVGSRIVEAIRAGEDVKSLSLSFKEATRRTECSSS